jgi:hypothetical protein
MAMKLGDHAAFPRDNSSGVHGMSTRTWLVGMALQGLLANQGALSSAANLSKSDGEKVVNIIAACAREHADAVLAELEK